MGFSRDKVSALNKHCIEIKIQQKTKQMCAGNLDAVVSQFWIPENAQLLTSGISDKAQDVGTLRCILCTQHHLTWPYTYNFTWKKKRLGGFKHKVTTSPYKVQVLIHCPNQYLQKEVWHRFALHLNSVCHECWFRPTHLTHPWIFKSLPLFLCSTYSSWSTWEFSAFPQSLGKSVIFTCCEISLLLGLFCYNAT